MYIHQIWYQGIDKLPYRYRVLSDRVKSLHPEYKHLIWSYKDIDRAVRILSSQLNDAELLRVYQTYPYMINRIDMGKYVILYLFGGMYLDMDMYVVRNLSPLIENRDRLIVTATSNLYARLLKKLHLVSAQPVNNAFLWAPRGHDLILNLINECKLRVHTLWSKILQGNKTLYVLYTTGPWALSKILERARPIKDQYTILDAQYLHSCRENDNLNLPIQQLIDNNTYALHLYDKSWDTSKGIIIPIIFLVVVVVTVIGCYYACKKLVRKH